MAHWTVGRYMTVVPQFISSRQKLIEAHKVMCENRIRHLPVIDEGRLVGIVSMGDLHLLETLDPVDPDEDRVEDAMSPDPYTVGPETALEEAARTMAERKYGSAIVVDRGKVTGIFTTIDALRAVLDLVASRGREEAKARPAGRSRRSKAKAAR